MFLIVLPVLIAIAGLVIDGGNAFATKRQVQNAADASALAAAQSLGDPVTLCDPGDTACNEGYRAGVKAKAEEYSHANGGPSVLDECDADTPTNCYTWPYNGSWAKIEVRLQKTAEGFFTQFVGLATDFFKPAARAVAGVAQEQHCYIGTPPVQRDDLLPGCQTSDEPGTQTPADTSDHCYVGDPPVLRDDLLPTCQLPDEQGNIVTANGVDHCYIGDPPVQRDDLLPDCVLPGQVGTTSGPTEPHCNFDGANPPVVNPDQYLNTTPPCTKPGFSEGGSPAIAYAHCGYPGDPCTGTSAQCTAMHISGSNNHFYGAIVSNAGVQESGGNYGAPPDGNALLYYGNQIDPAKCLVYKPTWAGPPTAQAPSDWPVPLPLLTCSNNTMGTSCPSGTWVTKVNGVNCTKLPTDKFTVDSPNDPSGQPWNGLYCATVKITINKTGVTVLNTGFIAPDIQFSSGNGHVTGYTGLYSPYGGLLRRIQRRHKLVGHRQPMDRRRLRPSRERSDQRRRLARRVRRSAGQLLRLRRGSDAAASREAGEREGTGPAFGSVEHPPQLGTLVPAEGAHCYIGNPPEQRDDLLPDCRLPGESGTVVPGDHSDHCYIGDPPVLRDDLLLSGCKLPGETAPSFTATASHIATSAIRPCKGTTFPSCVLPGENGTIVGTAGDVSMDE